MKFKCTWAGHYHRSTVLRPRLRKWSRLAGTLPKSVAKVHLQFPKGIVLPGVGIMGLQCGGHGNGNVSQQGQLRSMVSWLRIWSEVEGIGTRHQPSQSRELAKSKQNTNLTELRPELPFQGRRVLSKKPRQKSSHVC